MQIDFPPEELLSVTTSVPDLTPEDWDFAFWLPHSSEQYKALDRYLADLGFWSITKATRKQFHQINQIDFDAGTWELALATLKILFKKYGRGGGIIKANLYRALCDVNRLEVAALPSDLTEGADEKYLKQFSPVRDTFNKDQYPELFDKITELNTCTRNNLLSTVHRLQKGSLVVDLHSMMDRSVVGGHQLDNAGIQDYIDKPLAPQNLDSLKRSIDIITELNGEKVIGGPIISAIVSRLNKKAVSNPNYKVAFNEPYFLTEYHLCMQLIRRYYPKLDYLLIDIPKRLLVENPTELDRLRVDPVKIEIMASIFADAINASLS